MLVIQDLEKPMNCATTIKIFLNIFKLFKII